MKSRRPIERPKNNERKYKEKGRVFKKFYKNKILLNNNKVQKR